MKEKERVSTTSENRIKTITIDSSSESTDDEDIKVTKKQKRNTTKIMTGITL